MKIYIILTISSGKRCGRYSHQQRTEHTQEIQKLEMTSKMSKGILLNENKRYEEIEASLKIMTDMFMRKPSTQEDIREKQAATEGKYWVDKYS